MAAVDKWDFATPGGEVAKWSDAELGKAITKSLIVGVVGYFVIRHYWEEMLALATESLYSGTAHLAQLLGWTEELDDLPFLEPAGRVGAQGHSDLDPPPGDQGVDGLPRRLRLVQPGPEHLGERVAGLGRADGEGGEGGH